MTRTLTNLPRQTPQTSEDLTQITAILRVLSDPTRLRVFLLLREGEMCVCEIASALHLAENLVSHHLAALRRASLTLDRRDAADARWVYYRLNPERLVQCAHTLGALFDPGAIGTRAPTCGPAAPIMPQRVTRA